MTADNQDIDLSYKRETWRGFTKLMQWAAALSAITLILLAIFIV